MMTESPLSSMRFMRHLSRESAVTLRLVGENEAGLDSGGVLQGQPRTGSSRQNPNSPRGSSNRQNTALVIE
jgi:hypothetical protein